MFFSVLFLKYYFFNVLRRDLIAKYYYGNVYRVPKLKKVVLSFDISEASLKGLLPLLSALNMVSGQTSCLQTSKLLYVSLKVKTGIPVGCKVDIRGDNMFLFVERLIFSILPSFKEVSMYLRGSVFFLTIPTLFVFKELEKEYDFFVDLPRLNVSVVFNGVTRRQLIDFLIAVGLSRRIKEKK